MWASICAAKSGVGPIRHFDASNFPTKFAAEVKGYDFSHYVDDPEAFEFAGRNIRFAIGAASQAVTDSGIMGSVDPAQFGVYLGAVSERQNRTLRRDSRLPRTVRP
ncbi:hypothetical protein OAL44_04085 [Planctomycetaceae bacterium]|nr:hypothetical protein [Planctomycetaceae bacterium]